MRLFKRKSAKGYCNISEPVSDLDPARISAIKAKAAQVHVTPKEDKITTSNDDTFITETVTLETSQSAESSKCKQEANRTETQPESSVRRDDTQVLKVVKSAQSQDQDASVWVPITESSNDHISIPDPRVKIEAKTPETFFEGKNRKRIMDHASQAPTEHQIATMSMGEREMKFREPQVCINPDVKVENQSQSSDLDKTFSPQIVSVNSDITDPSFGISSRKRNQQSWKKLRKFRNYFHDSLGSKACEQKRPETFLDMFLDAICSYPGDKKS